MELTNTQQAERSVLGCIIINPDCMDVVSSILKSSDFLEENNSIIYSAMVRLYDLGEVIDTVTINQKVKLPLYIAELCNVASPSNFKQYTDLVKAHSLRRKVSEIAQSTGVRTLDDTCDPYGIIKDLEVNLAKLEITDRNTELSTAQIVDEVFENIKHLKENPQDVTGVSTGFNQLDKKTSGIQKSDLIILAARPSCGKSAFAMQLARNVSGQGFPTMFFSLEMSSDQLVKRLVASESKVSLHQIQSGGVSDSQLDSISRATEHIKSLPLFFNDKAGIQVSDIRAQIKLHNSKNAKLGLIVVDYLQLMIQGGGNVVQQVSEISRGLKMIAKEFNIPVIALSQLSRDIEKRGGKPRLSDLRDSGSIEQDADIVVFLHRETNTEDAYGRKEIDLVISKHRGGSLGDIILSFDGSKMTFAEVDDMWNL